MPAVRLSRRRRSSLAVSFNPAKAGVYGIHPSSPRQVTFAPNVTPTTYNEPDAEDFESAAVDPSTTSSKIFPPSETPMPPPARKRCPPGKRRSLGYIPRPPNAFMLFRADFVRQKHVPGSIETNHGSLSKIIGNCWRALPLEEKRVWEVRAKQAKAQHKIDYPDYRFKPIHNKTKDKESASKKKDKQAMSPEEELRCEGIAQLLVTGMKQKELQEAVQQLDERIREAMPKQRQQTPVLSSSWTPVHRRSSSVPLPNGNFSTGIALPSLPFFAMGLSSESPMLATPSQYPYQRRASSVQPEMFNRNWTLPSSSSYSPELLQHDNQPLPDVDTSLFEASFLNSSFSSSTPSTLPPPSFNFNDIYSTMPPAGIHQGLAPHEFATSATTSYASSTASASEIDPFGMWYGHQQQQQQQPGPSHGSSIYSPSPPPSVDDPLPPILHAPQPQHPIASAYADPSVSSSFGEQQWKGFEMGDSLGGMPISVANVGNGEIDVQVHQHQLRLTEHGDAFIHTGCGGVDRQYDALFEAGADYTSVETESPVYGATSFGFGQELIHDF